MSHSVGAVIQRHSAKVATSKQQKALLKRVSMTRQTDRKRRERKDGREDEKGQIFNKVVLDFLAAGFSFISRL